MGGRHSTGLSVLLLILAAAVGVAAFFAGRHYLDYKAPDFTGPYTLYIYKGMDASEVLDSLSADGRVKRAGSLRRCAKKEGLSDRVTPGKYCIDSACTAIYAIRMVCNGWQSPHLLTLAGTIRTRDRLAATIGRQMMTDSLSVAGLLNDTTFLASLGFTPENVFALFLPDTYEMYWTAPVEEIFVRFKREYDKFWTQERLDKAAAQGLTQDEVSVLASIVSGETLAEDEYAVIARVYLNRLRIGMPLQADPTIAFIHNYEVRRILKSHTRTPSPYNTYIHTGLPPAPINIPPKACIDAVLNPDDNSYLYFCASPDFNGHHRFANTYSDHLRNAREFQRALTLRLKEAKDGK